MAAGLGFKTFTTGEVLTAADTNGYLMQGVLVFASSAARASAITSPQEGQYSYLKDTDALEYYSGSAWVGAPVGDITGVTAGTGISGGGTSGTVTVSIDTAVTADLSTSQTLTNKTLTTPKISNYTTAGDIVYGTGSSVISRLGIGTAGQVLTVNSGATAPQWSTAASGGGMTLLSTTSLTGSSVTVSSIDQTYNNLYLLFENAYPAASTYLNMSVNADTTAGNYIASNIGLQNGAMAFRVGDKEIHAYGVDGGTARANLFTATLYDYSATIYKTWATYASYYGDSGASRYYNSFGNTIWKGSAAITSLTFTMVGSSFSGGTVKIYGVK